MSIPLLAAIISSVGLVIGSTIGAICSFFITKISLSEQVRLQKENIDYQEKYKAKELYINANIIRLDFCTAIYQSIRYLNQYEKLSEYYHIPIYKDYHKIVASLSENYSLKELSYIYQLYGIIDKVNNNLKGLDISNLKGLIVVRNEFISILKKVYGINYNKIIAKDIDNISYSELYNDELMKNGYREIFKSLNEICKKK